MSDVALIQTGQEFLLNYRLGDFESDEGFETAVLVSLLTDARVKDDELIAPETEKRGWWGDVAFDNPNDRIGSKLWLLDRAKLTEETRRLVKEYCEDALKWFVDDGIASEVKVEAILVPQVRIDLKIDIIRPNIKDKFYYRFQLMWENQYMNVRKV